MQGHLREESLSFTIETECGHCTEPIDIEMDSNMAYRVVKGEEPQVYVPMVNVHKLEEPSIIDGF